MHTEKVQIQGICTRFLVEKFQSFHQTLEFLQTPVKVKVV